jgi:hypothetical protein
MPLLDVFEVEDFDGGEELGKLLQAVQSRGDF